jgi:CheY-like chemotaxis protein
MTFWTSPKSKPESSLWSPSRHYRGNGRDAVAAYENEPFDLILMDIQMPELDGFEATAVVSPHQGKQRHAHP